MSTALLLGIPAQLKTLVTRISATWAAKVDTLAADWTTTRAAKQDNLDTTISSRAPSSTALTNAVWTDARAGYLANLVNGTPTTIKNRIVINTAMGNGSTSATASLGVTITLAKSILIMNGHTPNGSTDTPDEFMIAAELTATTVVFSRSGAGSSIAAMRAIVLEFY